jgi:hypothetical protein
MKYLLFSTFLFPFAMQALSQQDKISDQKDWEWLNLFYQGDATLKSNLIKFYNLLEDPKTPEDIEALFFQQSDLAAELSYAIDLSQSHEEESEEGDKEDSRQEDSFLIYESNMNHAISYLNEVKVPGFIFGCAAECTEFDVAVDYSVLIDAARKTKDHSDDIGLAIITDVWGIQRDYTPSFQSVECCACPGYNGLGSGEQFSLLVRMDKHEYSSNLFADEFGMIKKQMVDYLFWNDGFRQTDSIVLQEFELIKPFLNISKTKLTELYEKDPFTKYKLNYSIVDGQFFVNQKPIPTGCIAQLITELNGDNSQATIYLERNSLRGCMNANMSYPGGEEDNISYTIDDHSANDTYLLTVTEAVQGSMGASINRIIVKFINKGYYLKTGEKINVLSLDKIGEW